MGKSAFKLLGARQPLQAASPLSCVAEPNAVSEPLAGAPGSAKAAPKLGHKRTAGAAYAHQRVRPVAGRRNVFYIAAVRRRRRIEAASSSGSAASSSEPALGALMQAGESVAIERGEAVLDTVELEGSLRPSAAAGRRTRVRSELLAGDVLSRARFLDLLQREERRSDRSKAPLSLVLFRKEEGSSGTAKETQELMRVLYREKREIDTLGLIGTDLVALLCPETDQHGARLLARKMAGRTGELPFASATATYPDQLFEELTHGNTRLDFASVVPLESASGGRCGYRFKRVIDVAVALLALVVLLPVMLATAIAVLTTSRGPVIFRQSRLGKDGVPFDFFKFRSMTSNIDDRIHRDFVAGLIASGQGDTTATGGRLYKLHADPRVTPVGRFIRRFSIDELPQLVNVLKGDMSLVGPRPPLQYEAEKYQPWHLRRIVGVKPGMTGLWQVEGRSKVSFNDMVRLDLRYIRQCSFALDLKILVRTVSVVLRCDGAT